jgi:hypothetical protein
MSSENRFALFASCSRDPACRAPHAASAALLADVRSGKQRPERDARRGHGAAIPGCGLRHRRGGILIDPGPVAGRSAGGKSRPRRLPSGAGDAVEGAPLSGNPARTRRAVGPPPCRRQAGQNVPAACRARRAARLADAIAACTANFHQGGSRRSRRSRSARMRPAPRRPASPSASRGRAHIRAYLRTADRERAQDRCRRAGGKDFALGLYFRLRRAPDIPVRKPRS